MKSTIHADLPEELVAEAQAFVKQGKGVGLDELLEEALRRYLDSHSAQVTEGFIREDIAWGLHGKD